MLHRALFFVCLVLITRPAIVSAIKCYGSKVVSEPDQYIECEDSFFCVIVYVSDNQGDSWKYRGCESTFNKFLANIAHDAQGIIPVLPDCMTAVERGSLATTFELTLSMKDHKVNHRYYQRLCCPIHGCNLDFPLWNPWQIKEVRKQEAIMLEREMLDLQNRTKVHERSVSNEWPFLAACVAYFLPVLLIPVYRLIVSSAHQGPEWHSNEMPPGLENHVFPFRSQRTMPKKLTGQLTLNELVPLLYSIEQPQMSILVDEVIREAKGEIPPIQESSNEPTVAMALDRKKPLRRVSMAFELVNCIGGGCEEASPVVHDKLNYAYEEMLWRLFIHGPYKYPHTALELVSVISQAATLCGAEKNLMRLSGPMVVIGDIRGNYADLQRWLQAINFRGGKTRLLFMGNVIEQSAPFSIECLMLICSLKLKFPNDIFYLRGSNEYQLLCLSRERFKDDQDRKAIEDSMRLLFANLPLAAIIGDKVLVVHSGVSQYMGSEAIIQSVCRPHGKMLGYPASPLEAVQIATNLPSPKVHWYRRNTGVSDYFGDQGLFRILRYYHLELVIRSHSVVKEGFHGTFGGRLITIWSSADRDRDNAAILEFPTTRMNVCRVIRLEKPLRQKKEKDVSKRT